MDQIVDLLADLDYPDGMTAGLRRTTDVSRALVERSRADLTTTMVQERLRAELSERTQRGTGVIRRPWVVSVVQQRKPPADAGGHAECRKDHEEA